MWKNFIRVRDPRLSQLNNQIACDVPLCRWVRTSRRFEGITILRNVWNDSITSLKTWVLKFVSPRYGMIKTLTNKGLKPNILRVCSVLYYES